jgi:hypothetical protein
MCKGTPSHFPFFPTTPSLSGVLESSGILKDRLEFLNSTLSPLDSPHPTLRHTIVQSLLTLILCTCFPAFLARFPQSILFGSSLARSVVYYSLCIILSYIFSLNPPLLDLSDWPRYCKVALTAWLRSRGNPTSQNLYINWMVMVATKCICNKDPNYLMITRNEDSR